MSRINIASPQIGREEIRAVTEVLKSGMLAQGSRVAEFEEKFARFIGTKYAIASSSGTTALYLALISHKIGAGDEVITSPFTFIASANSILFTGAKPVFVDIEENSFNIDPEKIEKAINKKTKAIMPVHLYGNPCNMTRITQIARKHKLIVIEDACQAHGAAWDGRKAGSFGAAAFSFYPTKNMTCGEGGMITTDSREIYEKASLLRSHGSKIKYYHDILGYNFRLTDIAAAIGLEQLKKLNKFNKTRQKNAAYLSRNLGKILGLIVPEINGYSSSERSESRSSRPFGNTQGRQARTIPNQHVFHQYTIRITGNFKLSRDEVLRKLTEAGIGTAVFYPVPIHKQKLYQDLGYKDKLPVAEKAAQEVISLPVHPGVKEKDLKYIIKTINAIRTD